jgi:hypothetical protein
VQASLSEENPYYPQHHERRDSFSYRASHGDSDEDEYEHEYVDGLHPLGFILLISLGFVGCFQHGEVYFA